MEDEADAKSQQAASGHLTVAAVFKRLPGPPRLVLALLMPWTMKYGQPAEPSRADGGGKRPLLPEEKLNGVVLQTAFFYKVMSGFGALAFVWATVVLLGGFSTLIKPKDFWFVTIIVFMEATSLYHEPGDQFFVRTSEALLNSEKLSVVGRGSWRKARGMEEFTEDIRTIRKELVDSFCSRRFYLAGILTSVLAFRQVAAITTCVVLSILRLIKRDYVEPTYQGSGDHRNIKWSLNIFYVSVLAQGITFIVCMISDPGIVQMFRIILKYELGFPGIHIVSRYMHENYTKCVKGNVRDALNMDLVTFAMQMANSDSVEDRLIGVRTLDHILRIDKYKRSLLMRLRPSNVTIVNVVHMLNTQEEEDIRGHAARVVLELAPELLLESFPGMLQLVSSLITTDMEGKESTDHPSAARMELTLFGMQILEQLMDNPENCKQAKDANGLLSNIVNLTIFNKFAEEIIKASLKVLHKLVSTSGEAGRALRHDISENVHLLNNMRDILEKANEHLLVEATGILACLALDETGREEIGSSRRIIRKLVSLLTSRQIVEDRSTNRTRSLAGAAAEALVLLTTGSESAVARILAEIKQEDMQNVVVMLFDERAEDTIMIAKLMQNLLAYEALEYTHLLQIVKNELPKVLQAILQGVNKIEDVEPPRENPDDHNLEESRKRGKPLESFVVMKQGKPLESFVGLCMQICKYLDAKAFDNMLNMSNVSVGMFVKKLKKILDQYKSPTTDCPGIRRVTIKLLIWMMRQDKSYIEVFLQNGVHNTLKEVEETGNKIESFRLFYCGVGVSKHIEPISSLVGTSLALMAENTDGKSDTQNDIDLIISTDP